MVKIVSCVVENTFGNVENWYQLDCKVKLPNTLTKIFTTQYWQFCDIYQCVFKMILDEVTGVIYMMHITVADGNKWKNQIQNIASGLNILTLSV